jgi:hypothetical protein
VRRFVVLEHRWNGVHFDFMVEIGPDAPLRTWGIDAEPVSGAELPARGLPDHRRAYLTFEGEVSGGRGTVRRWDEGDCEVVLWGDDLVHLILHGRQLVGPVVLRRVSGLAPAAGGGASWSFRLGKLS